MKHPVHDSKEPQEISLRLEQYNDIYSDFDIRPYSKRSLSIDFLNEIKRASLDKNGGGIKLVLYALDKDRNESLEAAIRERLTEHFKKHHKLLIKEKWEVLRLGIGMMVLGIISMIAATLIVAKDPTDNLYMSFMVVFLEPAAWFLLWEGMDQIIFTSKNIYPDLNFYRKMSDSHGRISFESY